MPFETDPFPFEHVPEIAVPCSDIDRSLSFYLDALGFRLLKIFPADRPRFAIVEKDGLRLRLTADSGPDSKVRVRIPGHPPQNGASESPDGLPIEYVPPPAKSDLPEIGRRFIVSRADEDVPWQSGRAGMLYRDLVPDRLGGRLIASHIRIPEGGPVPDYVHYHQVDLQIIFCLQGEALLVYEDQGAPFRFRPGDCVLQPPGIRHRVLECSDGFEVIELSSPAEHPTYAEHDISLPTEQMRTERNFGGQRFLHHIDSTAQWSDWNYDGFECKQTGIGRASSGKADVTIVRNTGTETGPIDLSGLHPMFLYVVSGEMTIEDEESGVTVRTPKGTSFFTAGESPVAARGFSGDLSLLLVELHSDS